MPRGVGDRRSRVSALALGALLYTTVDSPGYYADRGDRTTVAMFAVLTAATAGMAIALVALG